MGFIMWRITYLYIFLVLSEYFSKDVAKKKKKAKW